MIELRIPEAQIKIKTANINEIKNIDLMAKDCEVRYIITINALKEGWDCPFAYILASLADRSSAVDVEQILGRVLRQPYVMKHNFPLLNVSYVLTASSKFIATLDNIVKGLNKAGFSERDYKLADPTNIVAPKKEDPLQQLSVFPTTTQTPEQATATVQEDVTSDIDTSRITNPAETVVPTETVTEIEKAAETQVQDFERTVADLEAADTTALPTEIQQLVKTYFIKEVFKEQAEKINLPQFYLKVPASQFTFGDAEYSSVPLEKEDLLKGFQLSKQDTNIAFDSITSELYRVDLDETKKEHTPTFVRLDGQVKESIMAYILDPARKDTRVKNIASRIIDMLGKMDPIPQSEINKYVNRIVDGFDDERFADFAANEYTYIRKIKDKIIEQSEAFAEKRFRDFLNTDKVFIVPSFTLPKSIAPGETAKNITKSLYEKEGKMNPYEERIINEVGNMQNIAFWTRNIERKGFRINGFVNHYPDFIIYTKSGKTVLLETKGDHLDAEQKIRLGNLWASKAGNNYRYFMVYEKRTVDGAYKLDDFLITAREM